MARANTIQEEMVGMTIASVLIPAILIIISLIYVAFYANGYSLFQKIVIIIIALIVVGAAEALLWMAWAGRRGLIHWQQPK